MNTYINDTTYIVVRQYLLLSELYLLLREHPFNQSKCIIWSKSLHQHRRGASPPPSLLPENGGEKGARGGEKERKKIENSVPWYGFRIPPKTNWTRRTFCDERAPVPKLDWLKELASKGERITTTPCSLSNEKASSTEDIVTKRAFRPIICKDSYDIAPCLARVCESSPKKKNHRDDAIIFICKSRQQNDAYRIRKWTTI